MANFDNLVPKNKQGVLGKSGTLNYEVVVFHTEHEYDTTETEAEVKKRIMAKFKDYDDALAYAQSKLNSPVYRVVLRS